MPSGQGRSEKVNEEPLPESESEGARNAYAVGGEPKSGAASPSDVLAHLLKITSDLERVWSEALTSNEALKVRRDAREVWNSFSETHQQWTVQVTEMWKRWGLDELVIQKFPLDDEALTQLGAEPHNEVDRYYRLQIALMYALLDLIEALKGLEEPSGREVRILPSTVGDSWWEAGAFNLIRRRAITVMTLIEDSETCLERVACEAGAEFEAISNRRVRRIWEGPLRAASGLVHQGWHEAALPQLLATIRAILAEALSIEPDSLPVPISSYLQEIENLTSIASHVSLLETCCQSLGKGISVERGVSVPLAKELTPRLQRLACSPPTADDLHTLKDFLGT